MGCFALSAALLGFACKLLVLQFCYSVLSVESLSATVDYRYSLDDWMELYAEGLGIEINDQAWMIHSLGALMLVAGLLLNCMQYRTLYTSSASFCQMSSQPCDSESVVWASGYILG